MVTCGFLLHFNFLSLGPLFVALVVGDLIGDVVWYYVGLRYSDSFFARYGRYFNVTEAGFEKAKSLFYKYHLRILIISKITLGFGMALVTLMAAGATRVSFKKFMILNLFGEIALVAMLLSVGYYLAKLYTYITSGYKLGFLIGCFILICAFVFATTNYFRQRALKM
jgi:membrane protein DedA with SNARE-associated domain